jgi:integrase
MRFTMNRIEALTCPAGKKDALFFDDELPGFGIRVSSGGGKAYLCQYRGPTGVRRVSLGKCSLVTLDAARRAAKEILGKAAGGADPVAERKIKAEQARAAKIENEFTVEALISAWASAQSESCQASYLKIACAALRTHLGPLLPLPASSITAKQAVAALHQAKAAAGAVAAKRKAAEGTVAANHGAVAANRLLSYARACYGWAVKEQHLTYNPFGDLKRPAREKSRDRVLADHELGAIWRAAGKVDWPAGQFCKLLMLTMARRDEVASMRWSEISADGETWTLPAERSKNRKAHVTHLTEPARGILGTIPRLDGCDFVFTTTGSTAISGFGGFKRALDHALGMAGEGIKDWRFHDFRRAGVTWLAGAGFPPHVADRLLNHVTGAIGGVAAVYQRGEFSKERQLALTAWAAHLETLGSGQLAGGNVVSLRA